MIKPEGRIDQESAPELERFLEENSEGISSAQFDFKKVSYISSAGLRVLLRTHKKMLGQGELKITGANETVSEIFDVTGFNDILNIE